MTSSRCCKKIDIDLEAEVVAGDVSPFDGVEKPSTQRRNISSILLHADVGVKDGSSQASLPSASSAFSDVDSLLTYFCSRCCGVEISPEKQSKFGVTFFIVLACHWPVLDGFN